MSDRDPTSPTKSPGAARSNAGRHERHDVPVKGFEAISAEQLCRFALQFADLCFPHRD
jgi:hypothetical protein